MSLIKYQDRTDGGPRGNLFWHRSDLDGLPFRGQQVPILREEEFEQKARVVNDAKVAILDVSVPKDRVRLEEIVDCAVNGWWQIYRFQEQFVPEKATWLVLVIYTERAMEVPPDKSRG